MRRPSPAMVVALVALVCACAGSATAATLITSKNVKDRSLRGRDLARDTVTGAQVRKLSGRDVIRNGLDGSDIDENTLDEVPSAARAGSVAGTTFARIAFRQAAGAGTQVVYDQGGLRIHAECTPSGGLSVTARPTADAPGQLRVSAQRPGGSTVDSESSFGGPDTAELVPADADDVGGTLTFLSPAGELVTLQYLAHETGGCVFAGNATRTSP